MQRELSAEEIIRAGRAHETCGVWERACDFTRALYGPAAARVTYSQTTFPAGDHRLRTIQALAFDAAGSQLAYDFTAPWWARRDVPEDMLARTLELTQDDLSRGMGAGFPDTIREELRAFAEECLGVETLHTWIDRDEDESETLTWMFDLTAPPSVPCSGIVDGDGVSLVQTDIIQAGREREALVRWQGVREYVQTLYGDRAVKTDVTMFSRYNDNTYDRDIRLEVFDAAGTLLFYDLRLPWWERFAFSEQEIASYVEGHDPAASVVDLEYDIAGDAEVDARAGREIEWLATVLLGADFIATRNWWDTDAVSYDLTQPPPLRYSHVWAEEDDEPVRN